MYPLFRKVEKLHLELDGAVPLHWASFLSELIDLTTVVELKVTGRLVRKANPTILAEISHLLQQTCKLSSLDICDKFYMRMSTLTAEHLCPMIPRHLKRLVTPVKNLDEVEKILDRLDHLSSVYFSFAYIPRRDRNIDWLPQKKRGSTYAIDSFSLVVWLPNSNIPSIETEVGPKRMKLTTADHSIPGLAHGACQED